MLHEGNQSCIFQLEKTKTRRQWHLDNYMSTPQSSVLITPSQFIKFILNSHSMEYSFIKNLNRFFHRVVAILKTLHFKTYRFAVPNHIVLLKKLKINIYIFGATSLTDSSSWKLDNVSKSFCPLDHSHEIRTFLRKCEDYLSCASNSFRSFEQLIGALYVDIANTDSWLVQRSGPPPLSSLIGWDASEPEPELQVVCLWSTHVQVSV